MTNHYYGIGFAIDSEDGFKEAVHQALLKGEVHPTTRGFYIRFRAGEGAELWVQAGPDRAVVGMAPHFDGDARTWLLLKSWVARPDESALDGACLASCPSPEGTSEATGLQVVFDLPDADRFGGLALPASREVQLSAFAHDLEAFPTEAAFHEMEEGNGLRFAAQSYVPTGLYAPRGGNQGAPEAEAMVSGLILDARTRVNPFTGREFQWLLLDTLLGQVDVVADPTIITGSIATGGVARGAMWMSGRILGETAPSHRQGPGRPLGLRERFRRFAGSA